LTEAENANRVKARVIVAAPSCRSTLPHGLPVGAEQLRIVDRAVMVHLAPNSVETPEHAGGADRKIERAAAVAQVPRSRPTA
jgi:hypothetical protein